MKGVIFQIYEQNMLEQMRQQAVSAIAQACSVPLSEILQPEWSNMLLTSRLLSEIIAVYTLNGSQQVSM